MEWASSHGGEGNSAREGDEYNVVDADSGMVFDASSTHDGLAVNLQNLPVDGTKRARARVEAAATPPSTAGLSSKSMYDKIKRSRTFIPHWLDEFPWLEFNAVEERMYCTYCVEYKLTRDSEFNNSFVIGSSNFRLDSVKAHDHSSRHKQVMRVLSGEIQYRSSGFNLLQRQQKKSGRSASRKSNELLEDKEDLQPSEEDSSLGSYLSENTRLRQPILSASLLLPADNTGVRTYIVPADVAANIVSQQPPSLQPSELDGENVPAELQQHHAQQQENRDDEEDEEDDDDENRLVIKVEPLSPSFALPDSAGEQQTEEPMDPQQLQGVGAEETESFPREEEEGAEHAPVPALPGSLKRPRSRFMSPLKRRRVSHHHRRKQRVPEKAAGSQNEAPSTKRMSSSSSSEGLLYWKELAESLTGRYNELCTEHNELCSEHLRMVKWFQDVITQSEQQCKDLKAELRREREESAALRTAGVVAAAGTGAVAGSEGVGVRRAGKPETIGGGGAAKAAEDRSPGAGANTTQGETAVSSPQDTPQHKSMTMDAGKTTPSSVFNLYNSVVVVQTQGKEPAVIGGTGDSNLHSIQQHLSQSGIHISLNGDGRSTAAGLQKARASDGTPDLGSRLSGSCNESAGSLETDQSPKGNGDAATEGDMGVVRPGAKGSEAWVAVGKDELADDTSLHECRDDRRSDETLASTEDAMETTNITMTTSTGDAIKIKVEGESVSNGFVIDDESATTHGK